MKTRINSIVFLIISVFFFSAIQIIVKILGDSVSSWAKAFYRTLFGLVFLIIWILLSKTKLKFNNIPVLLVRGAAGGIALAFSFWSVELVGLSRAIVYLYTFPVFAVIFSSVVYREKFNAWNLIPAAITLIGVFLISFSVDLMNSEDNIFKNLIKTISYKDIIGILSGITAGLAHSSVKHLRKTNNSANIYIFFLAVSMIICSAGIFIKKDQTFIFPLNNNMPVYVIWILIILLGLFATCAQLLMTYAYKHVSITTGTIVSTMTVPIVSFFALVVFKEDYNKYFIIGSVLIFVSILVIAFLKSKAIKADT